MRKVEYWVAEDGEEFDTEAACYEHEHQHDDLASRVVLIDDGKRIDPFANFRKAVEDCDEIIVDDDETAVELMDFFKYQGMESPWDKFNGLDVVAGHYFYDDYGWHCVESEIKELENRFYKMEKARQGV